MKIQREIKDYWDKYKDYSLESSSDKLEYNGSSLYLPRFDEEEEKRKKTKDSKKKKDICKSWKDDKKRVLLKTSRHIFKWV